MIARTLGALGLALSLALPSALAAAPGGKGYEADADTLYAALKETHPALYRGHTPAEWDAAFAAFRAKAGGLTREQFVVEAGRFLALADDGHTNFIPYAVGGPGFDERVPFTLFAFEEGLFVTHTTADWGKLAGAQLLTVNGHDAGAVAKAAGAALSADNPMWQLQWAPFMMNRPGHLHGLGYGIGTLEDGEVFRFRLRDGSKLEERIAPVAITDDLTLLSGFDTTIKDVPKPRYQTVESYYSLELLPGTRTLYVQYNVCASDDNEPMDAFAERLERTIRDNDIERVVVDVRANGGGDNNFGQPLLHALIRSRTIDRPGHLFVITGRQTFSAAQNFVNWAERHTQALIVGEPAAARPNSYGDATAVELPNVGTVFIVSTLFWQDSNPADARRWILPDVPVRPTFADFIAGRDAALDAALAYEVPADFEPVWPIYRWERASQKEAGSLDAWRAVFSAP